MTDLRPGRFQQLPLIVKNLIIINVLMVLLQFALIKWGINLQDYLALHYWSSPLFRWWQPFTHMFMHGSPDIKNIQETLLHIFSNMFGLWMFGRIIENLWGPKRFLLFYLICGLGAAACHLGVLTFEYNSYHNALMAYQANPSLPAFNDFVNHHGIVMDPRSMVAWNQNPTSPDQITGSVAFLSKHYYSMINEATVGASGAVMGVLFAFGYLFPNAEVMLIFPPIPFKVKWFVTVYAVFELYSGIQNSAGDNIAHFAHLGGMLFAFLLLRIWKIRVGNR